MGTCSSCDSNHAATAKLILQDGRLQEFPYPVKVSYVLQTNPTCFICNSDEMDFDDVVSAIEEDEELQPGQLYFALPLSCLKHRLQAEEMAALAVKASSALMKSNKRGEKCGCRCKSVTPLPVSEESHRRRVACAGSAGGGGKRGRRKFKAMLSGIPE
ncbi:hypothetical protein F3Y22_tig00111088pilonHSYRG00316 [Hibiscus syriacus]|uniref:Uncharacterized protein n=1 Tax=Hibiscus syriacus TaxID=106335 RepID=A0A6A2Z3M4_HIBSY|nr:uncharacterized protein LOC120152224 [Hibiscus syriacus]KAE8686009.1 hypothetical protein F3Y22_tig00111088pilonHSYRG00316 [Hibiscus syriacus]